METKKQKARKRLKKAVEAYLKRGGKITKIEVEEDSNIYIAPFVKHEPGFFDND